MSDSNKTYYAEPIKDGEIEGLIPIAEVVKKQILTDIREYLWRKMTTEISDTFYFSKREMWETAMRDLAEYAKKLGVEL